MWKKRDVATSGQQADGNLASTIRGASGDGDRERGALGQRGVLAGVRGLRGSRRRPRRALLTRANAGTLMNLAAAQPAVGIRRVPERSRRAQSAGIRVRGCVLVRWDGLVGMDLVRHAGICGDGHSKCHGQVLPGTGAGVRRPR